MAKTKAGGSSRLGRDSQPRYLGIKVFEDQKARPGMIIIRQKGTHFFPGKNVKRGKDNTLYALKEGVVHFRTKKIQRFDSSRKVIKIVNVEPR